MDLTGGSFKSGVQLFEMCALAIATRLSIAGESIVRSPGSGTFPQGVSMIFGTPVRVWDDFPIFSAPPCGFGMIFGTPVRFWNDFPRPRAVLG